MIEKNLLMFWHDPHPPEGVRKRVAAFSRQWPQLELTLLNDLTARAFLQAHFGARFARDFAACRIPAMRSDLIRLAWLHHHGGMYLDAKYGPRAFPEWLFQHRCDGIFLKHMDFFDVVNNGIILAPSKSPLLHHLTHQAFLNVAGRHDGCIAHLTGPGLLMRVLATRHWDVEIRDHSDIIGTHLDQDAAPKTRADIVDSHWSKRQETEPLYHTACPHPVPSSAH